MTIGDNRHYIGVLLYSYYTTVTGWGVLLIYRGILYKGYIGIVEKNRETTIEGLGFRVWYVG